MKCPNCNNENAEGSKFCIHCGNPIPQEEPVSTPVEEPIMDEPLYEPVQEEVGSSQAPVEEPVQGEYYEPQYQQPVEPQQPVQPQQPKQPQYSAAPNATSAQTAKKGQRRSLITILIIAVVVIVAIVTVLGFVLLGGGPKKLYQSTVKNAIQEALVNDVYDSKTSKVTATVELSSSDSTYKELDGAKVDVDLQYDLNAEQMIMKANAQKGEDSYLNLSAFVDLVNSKVYLNEKNLYSNTIEVELPEDDINEIKETFKFDELKEKTTSKEREAIADTLISALNDNMTKGKFKSKSAKIQVDGKDKSVKDNILSFSPSQLKAFIEGFTKTIEEDEKFEENLKAIVGDTVVVKDFLDELNDMAVMLEGTEEEGNAIEFHYYTYGLGKNFAGFAAVVVSNGEISGGAEIMMTAEKTFKVTVNDGIKDQEITTIKVNELKGNNVDVEVDLTNAGLPAVVKVKTAVESIKAIESFDTSKAVNINDMTEDDMTEIQENLEDSPLYSLIEQLGGQLSGGLDFDDDYQYGDTGIDEPTQSKADGQPYVKNGDVIVEYTIPSEFKEGNYSSDSFRSYTKETSNYEYGSVTAYISYDQASDCINDLIDLDYLYEDPDFYHDVKISSPKLEKINGRDYYTATVEYGFGSSGLKSYSKMYVTQINKDLCYVVKEEDDDGVIDDSEINELLNIKVK